MRIQVNVKQTVYKILFIVFFLGLSLVSYGYGGQSDACTVELGIFWEFYTCYSIEVSPDGRAIKFKYSGYSSDETNWVDLKQGGVATYPDLPSYPLFEIQNGQFRMYIWSYEGPISAGNWVNLCGQGKSVATDADGSTFIVEFNNGYLRFCFNDNNNCGSWVQFDYNYACVSCPQGYTYNPNRNICEAEPIYNYTCPYAGGTCVESAKSVAYCSPYNCNSTNIGTWCAAGNINTANMTANSIGMWQCSYDSSWFVDEASCKTGCNYFNCSYNNNWYQGDKSVCEQNCREKEQCVEVNQ